MRPTNKHFYWTKDSRWHVCWSWVSKKKTPKYELFWHWHVHFRGPGQFTGKVFITLIFFWSPVCPVYFVNAQLRPADAPIPRSCVIWQGSAKKREREGRERMDVWQLPVLSSIDYDERKEYISLIYWWEIRDNWAAGLMAASFRNSVWAAPEQDAQLRTTAPLTDHGQVFCHTTDAIAPIPSDYHLVSFDLFFYSFFFWLVYLFFLNVVNSHLCASFKSLWPNTEARARLRRCACTGARLLSYFLNQHVTEISPVLMLTFTESQAGHGRDVKRCTRSTKLARRRDA